MNLKILQRLYVYVIITKGNVYDVYLRYEDALNSVNKLINNKSFIEITKGYHWESESIVISIKKIEVK